MPPVVPVSSFLGSHRPEVEPSVAVVGYTGADRDAVLADPVHPLPPPRRTGVIRRAPTSPGIETNILRRRGLREGSLKLRSSSIIPPRDWRWRLDKIYTWLICELEL